MQISINPNLDLEPLRQEFETKGRTHIPDFLTEDSVTALLEAANEDIPWNMVFNKGKKHFDLHPPQIEALTPEQSEQLRQTIYAQARGGFQYWYNNYPVHDAVKSGNHPHLKIHGIDSFVNSEAFLKFAMNATGVDGLDFADCMLSAYGPCHFLSHHDDGIVQKSASSPT